MNIENEMCLNDFSEKVSKYLENNTVEDLCRLIFKCIPKQMVVRVKDNLSKVISKNESYVGILVLNEDGILKEPDSPSYKRIKLGDKLYF